jgi:hypothetical protein
VGFGLSLKYNFTVKKPANDERSSLVYPKIFEEEGKKVL